MGDQSNSAAAERLTLQEEVAAAEAALENGALYALPPFQPLRAIASLAFTAAGFGLYQYVMRSFWASPIFGIHDPIPYPAYLGVAASLALCLIGLRIAVRLWSPHTKLALGILAFFAAIVVGVSGGRFVSYTLRGTLNPPFTLNLHTGDPFPKYALVDQFGVTHSGPPATKTLVIVYRGDFCPFARHELAEIIGRRKEFETNGINLVAISADPVDRSKMLAGYLNTDLPLLSDASESILGPLGLVEHHRDGEPDNAIPAFFVVEPDGGVRWIFTSRYYREMPTIDTLLRASADAR